MRLNLSMLEGLRGRRGIDIIVLLACRGEALTKDEIVNALKSKKGDQIRKWVNKLVELGWLEEIPGRPNKYKLAELQKLKERLFPDC